MDESLKDKILLIKKNKSISNVNFFNDGTSTKDEYSSAKRMENNFTPYVVSEVEEIICKAAENYSDKNDFDSINMDLLVGIIYRIEDIDDNGKIKEGAQPVKNIVRYYTSSVRSCLNGEVTNETSYKDYYWSRQGFMNYNDFVSLVRKEGLIYRGPETFKEFKETILSGETFDINVEVNLKEKTDDKRLIRRR